MDRNRQVCNERESNLHRDINVLDQAPPPNSFNTIRPSSSFVAPEVSSTSTYYAQHRTRSPPTMVTPTAPFGSVQDNTALTPVARSVFHDQFGDASDDEDTSAQLQRVGRYNTTLPSPAKPQQIQIYSSVSEDKVSRTASTGSSCGLDALALAAAVSTTNKEDGNSKNFAPGLFLQSNKTSVNSLFRTLQNPSIALPQETVMLPFVRSVTDSSTANLVPARVVSDYIRTETFNNKSYAGEVVDPVSESTDDFSSSTQIGNNDVLCGRGGLTNHHQGNVFFRNLVRSRQKIYLEASKRDKSSVARDIVDTIRKLTPPGRFLKKDRLGVWVEIGNRKAREKTSQALREGAPELRDELSPILNGQVVADDPSNVTASDLCNSTQVVMEDLPKKVSHPSRVISLEQSQVPGCAPLQDWRVGPKRQKSASYAGVMSMHDDEDKSSFCRSQEAKRCPKKRISDRIVSSTV